MSRLPEHDRLLELLADRATQGLSEVEAREIDRLLADEPGSDAEGLEYAAAVLSMAFTPTERAPEHMKRSLSAAASHFVAAERDARAEAAPAAPAPRPAVAGRIERAERSSLGSLGWLAAAAAIVVAALAWVPRGGPAVASFEQVVAQPDLRRWDWAPGPDVTGREVKGEVVWSSGLQQGYMVFRGLPPLDRTQAVYQLWIFDPAQKHPIDGGVFVVAGPGEVRVPIDAKIRVTDPAAFAVTVEPPGGVVVSDQSRITVLAKRS